MEIIKKSMAYIKNVVAFIDNRINKSKTGFHVYNYIDKPDYNMNELVKIIQEHTSVSIPKFKIPFYVGLFIGYFFDLISFLTRIKFSISSVRIIKFCATTQFNSEKCIQFLVLLSL